MVACVSPAHFNLEQSLWCDTRVQFLYFLVDTCMASVDCGCVALCGFRSMEPDGCQCDSTLRYASRARSIHNRVKLNTVSSPDEETAFLRRALGEREAEIKRLKVLLSAQTGKGDAPRVL
jgi:hypothetical protein